MRRSLVFCHVVDIETVKEEVFSKKEEFELCSCRFGERFRLCVQECCMVGFEEAREEERLVRIVQSMFGNARNHVIANGTLSYDFLVQWEGFRAQC